jgi:hypothetical protein
LNVINELLQGAQYRAGRSHVSRTTVSCLARYPGMPVVALRAVLNNPHTSLDDLREVLDEQRHLAIQAGTARCASALSCVRAIG